MLAQILWKQSSVWQTKVEPTNDDQNETLFIEQVRIKKLW
jgi:hypothetical protein